MQLRKIKLPYRHARKRNSACTKVFALFVFCTLTTGIFLNSGCAVKKKKVYEKDGNLYGTTGGIFKSKWDDFYHRGVSYAEGGYWEEAADDFKEALRKRAADQHSARTYGIHFIDYFPNREMGIACYNLRRYREAVQFLETSLKDAPTARAKFYINKARQAWLRETGADTAPPGVSVLFPPANHTTNKFTLPVKAKANDDYFVSNIIVNGQPSRLELSQKEVDITQELPLRHGRNTIMLQSEDILGKKSPSVTIQVTVDREGPLVYLKAVKKSDGSIAVEGAAYDGLTVRRISINGRSIVAESGALVGIHETLDTRTLSSAGNDISFEAEDAVGNTTRGRIPLVSTESSGTIKFLDINNNQTVFRSLLSLQAQVQSPGIPREVKINGQSLLGSDNALATAGFMKTLRETPGGILAFSKSIQLEDGRNSVTVTHNDVRGKSAAQSLVIIKKTPKVYQTGSRLSVAIFRFAENVHEGKPLQQEMLRIIAQSFKSQGRFFVIDDAQCTGICNQEKIPAAEGLLPEQAVSLGSKIGADAVLTGRITISGPSVEITAALTGIDASELFAEHDIYLENTAPMELQRSIDRLALKFKEQFPVVEGSVISRQGERVTLSLGKIHSLCRDMKLIGFREEESAHRADAVVDPGRDTNILALLSIREIERTASGAVILKKLSPLPLEEGDRVIIK